MALFSDIDWIIIAGVAALLLFGSNNLSLARTLGHYYGKLMHLKQNLLSEVTKSADLPAGLTGSPASLRAAFLGIDSTGNSLSTSMSAIPAVVTSPPVAPYRPSALADVPWASVGVPTPTWSVALPAVWIEPEAPR